MAASPIAVLLLAPLVANVAAQQGQAGSALLPGHDIVVTGERTPRSLRDTPSSVVVETADTIEAQAAADRIEQLLALVPNVQLGSGEEGVAIRGQDSTGLLRNLFAFLGGARPRVTLQVDGRPLSYYEYVFGSAALWDVERVEIYRSPQTTTQGRNSIAGAIFVTTQDPTYAWTGRGRAVAGQIGTRQVSAMLSGPLIADQLAVRIAGDLRRGRMASDLADGIAEADIRRDDYGFVRVKLLGEPQALPGVRIETSYVHLQSQAPQFEAVRAPFRARRVPVPDQTNGIWRTNVDSLTTVLGAELGTAVSSSTTLSYGKVKARRFGLPGLGQTRVHASDFAAENILTWRPSEDLQLLVGANLIEARQRQSIDITGLGIGSGGFRDNQTSLGLFSEGTWRPVPSISLTAGLRYQRDRQDRAGQVGSSPGGIGLAYDQRFDAWLPKLSLAYEVTDDLVAGVLVQRAYNPGGTSISLLRRAEDRFAAESLWNYEAFVRGSLAGGALKLAGNVFANHIKDAQRSQTVEVKLANGTSIFPSEFANAPAAKTYGAELELGWRASPRLYLRAGLGLLKTRVTRTLLERDASLGKAFQRSPVVSAAAAVDWHAHKALRLSAQVRHNGRYFSDDANTPERRIGAATVVDARAAYERGPVTLFGYARNLLDSFYLTYLFNPTFGTAGDPRELGVGIEARF